MNRPLCREKGCGNLARIVSCRNGRPKYGTRCHSHHLKRMKAQREISSAEYIERDLALMAPAPIHIRIEVIVRYEALGQRQTKPTTATKPKVKPGPAKPESADETGTCPLCHRTLLLSEFYRFTMRGNGRRPRMYYRGVCKKCWQRRNAEQARARTAARQKQAGLERIE